MTDRVARVLLWLAVQLETLAYRLAPRPIAPATVPRPQVAGANHAAIIDASDHEEGRPLMLTGRLGGHLLYTRLRRPKRTWVE